MSDPDHATAVPHQVSRQHLSSGHRDRRTVRLGKGASLHPAGAATSFVRVEKGLLILTATDRRGDEATLEIVGPGGSFGELSLVGTTETVVGATALVPSTLTLVGSADSCCSDLLPAVLAVLSARVRLQQDTIVRHQRNSLSARLAQLLLDLSTITPVVGPGSLPDLTQADLARVLSSPRESVSRLLGKFEDRGWVHRSPRLCLPSPPSGLMQHAGLGTEGPVRRALMESGLRRQAALASLVGLPPSASLASSKPAPHRYLRPSRAPQGGHVVSRARAG